MKEPESNDIITPASMEQPPQDLSEREKAFDRNVSRNFRWNFTVNLLYGLFGTTGWRLIMAPTFVPDYMYKLGGSNTIVGLLLFCGGISRFLMPPITASLVEHRPFLKNMVLVIGSLMRLQVLLMAVAGFFFATKLNIISFFVFFSLFNMFLGVQNVVYNTVMAKVIPVERRGRFLGLRNFVGGVTAALVALAAGSLIDSLIFPHSYAATYLLAFGLTFTGLLFFACSREPATPAVLKKRPPLKRLRTVPGQLKEDRNFANYCICCAVASFALMSNPFFILYVGNNMTISGAQLGQLTFVFFLAQTSINLLFGRIADRSGFRRVFIISTSLWTVAMLMLILAPASYTMALIIFASLGAGVAGYRMSRNNMVLEFGDTAGMPMRIAIVNSTAEFANAIGPLMAGILADKVSYQSVFVISIICTMSALALMWLSVTEPRKIRE